MGRLSTQTTIAVIGAGTMGAGIAQVAAQGGHRVLLYDAAPGSAQTAIAKTAEGLQRQVQRGKFSPQDATTTLARLSAVDSLEELACAGLVIEAILEDLAIKQKLFRELEGICGPNTILASNTSSLSITTISSVLARPENFIGLHFFNPAQVMKLVEVISGAQSDPTITACAFDTAAAWGKKPVHATSSPGFIVNRVARPFYGEALRMLEEGLADAPTIDAIMRESGGFRMGPFELMDLIGNDINLAVTTSVYNAFDQNPRFEPSPYQAQLVGDGKLGRKSGCGFYDYSDGGPAQQAITSGPGTPPRELVIYGHLGIAEGLAAMIEKAGIVYQRQPSNDQPGFIQVGPAHLHLSDGNPASRHGNNAIAFDLALDYQAASRIALAPAGGCYPAALGAAVGLFQALGKSVSVIGDGAGMVVMRTICMLANEGADAVQNKVCTAPAVDTAMRYGVNYPAGPLQWANDIGLGFVAGVLDNMLAIYDNPRYRCAPLIREESLF